MKQIRNNEFVEQKCGSSRRNFLRYPIFVVTKVETGKPFVREISHFIQTQRVITQEDGSELREKERKLVTITISAPRAVGPRDQEAFRIVERRLHKIAHCNGGTLPKEQVGVYKGQPVYVTKVDLGSMYRHSERLTVISP